MVALSHILWTKDVPPYGGDSTCLFPAVCIRQSTQSVQYRCYSHAIVSASQEENSRRYGYIELGWSNGNFLGLCPVCPRVDPQPRLLLTKQCGSHRRLKRLPSQYHRKEHFFRCLSPKNNEKKLNSSLGEEK